MAGCTGRNMTLSGGRRRRASRKGKKGTRKASSWTAKVTALYKKMKKENPAIQFRDALVKASKLKKSGQL